MNVLEPINLITHRDRETIAELGVAIATGLIELALVEIFGLRQIGLAKIGSIELCPTKIGVEEVNPLTIFC